MSGGVCFIKIVCLLLFFLPGAETVAIRQGNVLVFQQNSAAAHCGRETALTPRNTWLHLAGSVAAQQS